MAVRTVRLGDEAEPALREIEKPQRPYDLYERLDLGARAHPSYHTTPATKIAGFQSRSGADPVETQRNYMGAAGT